jgi:integrase
MTVYKPKASPYYHFDYQYRGVRYHGSTNCKSKRDAERLERDHRTEVATGKKDKPAVTLDEGLGIYCDAKGQFDRNAKDTETQLGNILRLVGGNTLLQDVGDIEVAKMVAIRRTEKVFPNRRIKRGENRRTVSAATVNRETELLRRAHRFLGKKYKVAEEAIDWNSHKLKEPKERVREASPEEEARLFAVLVEKYSDMADLVEFALLCGARRKAVVKLLWSKIDRRNRAASVHTKGDVWHEFPLSDRMIEIIANRPQVGPFVFTYVCERPAPARDDRPRRIKGERYPFSEEGWNRKWYRALAEAGKPTSASTICGTPPRAEPLAHRTSRSRRSCSVTRGSRRPPDMHMLVTTISEPHWQMSSSPGIVPKRWGRISLKPAENLTSGGSGNAAPEASARRF